MRKYLSEFVGTLGGGDLTRLWFYLVGPFGGGILAAFVFKLQATPELSV